MRSFLSCTLFFACLVSAVGARAQYLVDPASCTVTINTDQRVSLVVCPDNDGTRLDRAQLFGGETVDAAIEVVLRDAAGRPAIYATELDLWLAAPGMEFCRGSNVPDFPIAADGSTGFLRPRRGGGCLREPGLRVIYNGDPLGDGPIPNVIMNSPDLNGDGVINLVDVYRFAEAFDNNDYAGDFVWDGRLDLADVAAFARHLEHSCP